MARIWCPEAWHGEQAAGRLPASASAAKGRARARASDRGEIGGAGEAGGPEARATHT